MCTRFGVAAVIGLVLSVASTAAPIRFDFGNGVVDDPPPVGTGVAANVVITQGTSLSATQGGTVDGVTITLNGIANPQAGSIWGSTASGIGIETAGQAGGDTVRRRIDGPLGEFVHFSFDTDVTINSIRLGNMQRTGAGVEEVVEIDFVSGDDPFAGGSFTYSTSASGATGPTDDLPVGVFVTADTVLSFSTSVPQNNGVLWNDIAVTPIPEPATLAMLAFAVVVGIACGRRRIDQCSL